MKKIVFGLVATFSFLNLLSCSNDNNIEKENTVNNRKSDSNIFIQEKLSNDSNFIELVVEMEKFKNYTKDIIEKNKLDINNVQLELNSLNAENFDYDTQIKRINFIFKTDISERYAEHYKIFNKNWIAIKNKYSNIEIKNLEEAYNTVLSKTDAGLSDLSGGCGWRYNLCIAAAGAGAVICHASCDTTALATTAGLGIPACVWACTTLQVAASVQCYDTYCK